VESAAIQNAWRALNVVLQYVADVFDVVVPDVHGLEVHDVFERVYGTDTHTRTAYNEHDSDEDLERHFPSVSSDEEGDDEWTTTWKSERRERRQQDVLAARQRRAAERREETDEERRDRKAASAIGHGGKRGSALLWEMVQGIARNADVGLIGDPYPYPGLTAGEWGTFEETGINYDDWARPRFVPSEGDDDAPSFPEGYRFYVCGIDTVQHVSALIVDTTTRCALFVDSNGTYPDDIDPEVPDNPLPTSVAVQKLRHTLKRYINKVDVLVDFNAQRGSRVCSGATLFAITAACLTKDLEALKHFLTDSVYSLDLPYTVFNDVMSVFAAKMLLMFARIHHDELKPALRARSEETDFVDVDLVFKGLRDYGQKSAVVQLSPATAKNKGVVNGTVRVLLHSTVGDIRRVLSDELTVPIQTLVVYTKLEDGSDMQLSDDAKAVDVFPYTRGVLRGVYVTEVSTPLSMHHDHHDHHDTNGSKVTSSGGRRKRQHQ
jgi:hypothetical protein